MSIRDKFILSEPSSEIVDVDLVINGVIETVKIEVREQTVDQQYTILDKARDSSGTINMKQASIEAVIATSYDPDTGDRAFDDADRDMLGTKSAKAFQQLFTATSKAAGLESDEEAVSDLDDAQTDEPSTS